MGRSGYQDAMGEQQFDEGKHHIDVFTISDRISLQRRNETEGGASQRRLKVVEAAFESQDDESEFDYFQRMMFWVPALFLIVCFCHAMVIAYFVVTEKEIPDILQPPRLELMLAFFSLPPISIACAGLYKTDRGA